MGLPASGMASMMKQMLGIDPEQIRAEMAKFVTDTSDVLHGYDDKLKHIMLRLDNIEAQIEIMVSNNDNLEAKLQHILESQDRLLELLAEQTV